MFVLDVKVQDEIIRSQISHSRLHTCLQIFVFNECEVCCTSGRRELQSHESKHKFTSKYVSFSSTCRNVSAISEACNEAFTLL